MLKDIYIEYGFSQERLISIVRKGKSGADEIKAMMHQLRTTPPTTLGGSAVNLVKDYTVLKAINPIAKTSRDIDLPEASDVLQFFTEDGSKVSVRPSGTEPKIKFYFEVKTAMNNRDQFEAATQTAQAKIDRIVADLGLD